MRDEEQIDYGSITPSWSKVRIHKIDESNIFGIAHKIIIYEINSGGFYITIRESKSENKGEFLIRSNEPIGEAMNYAVSQYVEYKTNK